MADPTKTKQRTGERTPTPDELEAEIGIDADFDDVMDAVTGGYGTSRRGHHPI